SPTTRWRPVVKRSGSGSGSRCPSSIDQNLVHHRDRGGGAEVAVGCAADVLRRRIAVAIDRHDAVALELEADLRGVEADLETDALRDEDVDAEVALAARHGRLAVLRLRLDLAGAGQQNGARAEAHRDPLR